MLKVTDHGYVELLDAQRLPTPASPRGSAQGGQGLPVGAEASVCQALEGRRGRCLSSSTSHGVTLGDGFFSLSLRTSTSRNGGGQKHLLLGLVWDRAMTLPL